MNVLHRWKKWIVVLVLGACSWSSAKAEFTQTAKLKPGDAVGGDRFGAQTALSGEVLVVAAPEHRSNGKFGAAYVYTKSEGGWQFSAELVSPYGRPFATAVAIDGETIIVGAMEDRSEFGGVDAGLAFIFTRAAGAWTLAAELRTPDAHSPNRAASAVAVQNGTAVVGVDSDSAFGSPAGAAYVFGQAGDVWNFQQKLYASELSSGARFGSAIDLDGDFLAISAQSETSNRGAVHLFGRENNIWTHRERIVAPDSDTGNIFGRSVALRDGFLAVGRTDDNDAGQGAGAVYVFRVLADTREFVQKLFAGDAAPFSAFGTSVSISEGKIFAGAPSAPVEGSSTVGAVYVFALSGDQFAQTERITADDPTAFSGFGWSLSSDEGNVAVGAVFQESSGVTYVFEEAVADTEPPVISSAVASPAILSPPNGKLEPVSIAVEAQDNSGETHCEIVSVQVDDADPRKEPVYEITGDLTLRLRAERNARGQTRTYSVVVRCSDAAGNAAETTVQVKVP
jgi:hypothetical protein